MVINYFLFFPSWDCISSPLESRLACDLPWPRGWEGLGICDFQVWEVTYAKRPAASAVLLSTGKTALRNLGLLAEQPVEENPDTCREPASCHTGECDSFEPPGPAESPGDCSCMSDPRRDPPRPAQLQLAQNAKMWEIDGYALSDWILGWLCSNS